MPSRNKKPAGTDLSAILDGLLQAEIRFILVGGLAAVVQGAPVTTMDIDILHQRSKENIAKLISFLKSIDATHRRPDDKVLKVKEDDISGTGHALLMTRLGPLDCLGAIEGGRTYDDLLGRTVEIEFRGRPLLVLDLKTLVYLKRDSKNPGDRQRLSVLEETLRQMDDK
jgi:hypothetical protein